MGTSIFKKMTLTPAKPPVSSFGTSRIPAVANGNRGLCGCWGSSSINWCGTVSRWPAIGTSNIPESRVTGRARWGIVRKRRHGAVSCKWKNKCKLEKSCRCKLIYIKVELHCHETFVQHFFPSKLVCSRLMGNVFVLWDYGWKLALCYLQQQCTFIYMHCSI